MELKIKLDKTRKEMLEDIRDYYINEYGFNFNKLQDVIQFLIYKDYIIVEALKSEKESDKNENKDIV